MCACVPVMPIVDKPMDRNLHTHSGLKGELSSTAAIAPIIVCRETVFRSTTGCWMPPFSLS